MQCWQVKLIKEVYRIVHFGSSWSEDEIISIVDDAIAHADFNDREYKVLELYYINGMDKKECAKVLDVRVSIITDTIHKIKRKLYWLFHESMYIHVIQKKSKELGGEYAKMAESTIQ